MPSAKYPFISSVNSMPRPSTGAAGTASIARFGGYFTKSMKDVYLRPAPPAPTASTKEEA